MTIAVQDQEQQLYEACLLEDRVAQKQLFDRHKNWLFSTCFRILNDYDLANDALQEGFIEIFRDLHQLKNVQVLTSWMKTIVIRKSIRKKQFESRFETMEEPEEDVGVDWMEEIDSELLDKSIRSLPDGYRAVFLLVVVEGYGHQEVSELLGIHVGTSRSQLFHAKKTLRKQLENHLT